MKNDLVKIEELLNSQNKRPSVFIEIWSEPIMTAGGTPDLEERENFSYLSAIKEDRVSIIDQNRISRPGPRAVAGLVELVKYFHPDLEDELKEL